MYKIFTKLYDAANRHGGARAIHPQIAGNAICEVLHLKIFSGGGHALEPP